MLEYFSKEVIQYCEDHTVRSDEVLDRIETSTRQHSNASGMLSGPYQGVLLRMLSQMLQPSRILEIGTFTGYSAVCMAEGLASGGKLITLEKDISLQPLIEMHLSWSPLGEKIEVHFGDARELLKDMDEVFELVFIDAAKKQYGDYYELVIDRLKPGGIMMIDNVLWRGKVVDENPDGKTRSIQEFNRKVHDDERVQPFLMPIRDGLYLVRKK